AASRTRSTVSSGITAAPPRKASRERGHGHTRASLVPRTEPEGCYPRILAQHLGNILAQHSGTLPVDDTELAHVRPDGGVQCLKHDTPDLIHTHPPHIHLRRHLLL